MNRKIALLILGVAAATFICRADSVQEKYIEKYKDLAVSEMLRSGVPASITMAQGMLESSYGNSTLAREANNHFGIKCGKNWEGEKVYHDDDAAGECFRKYKTADQSFTDHSDFIRYSSRYSALFSLEPTDYVGWANGLKAAGYATDSRYASKLIELIEKYKLYKLDVVDTPEYTLPQSPEVLSTPQPVVTFDASWNFPIDRQLYTLNGIPVIYTFPEDTYKDLALKYNLFPKEILRFNDLQEDPGEILPGTVVYLKHKKAKAVKGQEKHVVDYAADGVEPAELLHWISQKYGIRMKSLLKMNKLTSDAVIADGTVIILRK